MEGVPFLIAVYIFYKLIGLSVLYIRYKRSNYKAASGNSFASIVFNKGYKGEFLIFKVLEKLPGYKKILANLYVPKTDGATTEIDLVLVNSAGIYVIESKNLNGFLSGHEKEVMWTQNFDHRKKLKFYNPIMQNQGHINALEGILGKGKQKLCSCIVFGSQSCFKRVFVKSSDIIMVNRKRLSNRLAKDLLNRPRIFSKSEIDKIGGILETYAHADKKTKREHIRLLKKQFPA